MSLHDSLVKEKWLTVNLGSCLSTHVVWVALINIRMKFSACPLLPGCSRSTRQSETMPFNGRSNSSLPCYIKKKGKYRNEDEKILMSFKKFNDSQKDNPCVVSHTWRKTVANDGAGIKRLTWSFEDNWVQEELKNNERMDS